MRFRLFGRIKTQILHGKIQQDVTYPDNVLHWDMKKDTLDQFLQRRIDYGYPGMAPHTTWTKRQFNKENNRWFKKMGI